MIKSDTSSKPLLFEFLRYLKTNLGELTDNRNNSYTEEEKWKLGRLGGAAETLASFAEEIGDKDLCVIVDDFIYTVNKTSMGASFSAQSGMIRFEDKIDNYERKADKLNRRTARLWKIE